MNPWYTDYSEYISQIFPAFKVQKLSVDAGFTCPNRDGRIGTGGCIYCDNSTFTPSYCRAADPVSGQIAKGRAFFGRKYPDMRYLAYFQSFTGTYGRTPGDLRALYQEAIDQPGVVGLIVGTRPDCLTAPVAELLGDIAGDVPVFVELGAESSCDRTLRAVNRGHTWAYTARAADMAAAAGLHVGLHLIMGLPGESADRSLQSVADACRLPVESLKLHQLQVIEGTALHRRWLDGRIDVQPYTLDDYLRLCVRVVEAVPRTVAIERFVAQAPPGRVAAPRWGLKNYQFTQRLHQLLAAHSHPQ